MMEAVARCEAVPRNRLMPDVAIALARSDAVALTKAIVS
jgi:hypothetical protein